MHARAPPLPPARPSHTCTHLIRVGSKGGGHQCGQVSGIGLQEGWAEGREGGRSVGTGGGGVGLSEDKAEP